MILMMNKEKIIRISLIFFFVLLSFSNIYASGSQDYEMSLNDIKIKVFGDTGSSCLYAHTRNEEQEYIPLYNDATEDRASEFFVYYNGKSYELDSPTEIEQKDYSIIITYKFKNKFVVKQTLSFANKKYGMSEYPLKIDTKIKNIGKATASIALKALFDTKLGENNYFPLYTDLKKGIREECILKPNEQEASAIISSNEEYACLFLIKNSLVSSISKIYIANWDKLQARSWIPPLAPGRVFKTKSSKTDEALLFTWPMQKLLANEESNRVMLIGYYDYLKKSVESLDASKNKNREGTEEGNYSTVQEVDSDEEDFVDLTNMIKPMTVKKSENESQDEEEAESDEKEDVAEEEEVKQEDVVEPEEEVVEPLAEKVEVEEENEEIESDNDENNVPQSIEPKEEIVEVQESKEQEPESLDKTATIKKIPVDNSIAKKNYLRRYTYIKIILEKVKELEGNFDNASYAYIEELTKQVDAAINDIKKDDTN